mmetsp:Transcript_19650/g.45793  ORF Transcript_19650/g.45793 Transcript_19650/m.45793 type:complete len:212 (+) Transcript_19650:1004-1639(+)
MLLPAAEIALTPSDAACNFSTCDPVSATLLFRAHSEVNMDLPPQLACPFVGWSRGPSDSMDAVSSAAMVASLRRNCCSFSRWTSSFATRCITFPGVATLTADIPATCTVLSSTPLKSNDTFLTSRFEPKHTCHCMAMPLFLNLLSAMRPSASTMAACITCDLPSYSPERRFASVRSTCVNSSRRPGASERCVSKLVAFRLKASMSWMPWLA